MYTNLNTFFSKFIIAEGKSGPPKGRQDIPVGSQAHRVLYCLPKVDGLFIATELACESNADHKYLMQNHTCIYINIFAVTYAVNAYLFKYLKYAKA
jgi:hypothetical protein